MGPEEQAEGQVREGSVVGVIRVQEKFLLNTALGYDHGPLLPLGPCSHQRGGEQSPVLVGSKPGSLPGNLNAWGFLGPSLSSVYNGDNSPCPCGEPQRMKLIW